MSEWRDEINRKALARLTLALPAIFPRPALIHALGRRFTPPMPRLAIDSYWRAHPVRADRLARALARKSGAPPGWTWRLANEKRARMKRRSRNADDSEPDWLSVSFRIPPAPYRERGFARGAGFCCVCGQPLEPGKYADLAVLSDDYLTVPVEQVGDLHSVLTMVGGKAVYGEGPFAALEGK